MQIRSYEHQVLDAKTVLTYTDDSHNATYERVLNEATCIPNPRFQINC
jgi:hypothetical protein